MKKINGYQGAAVFTPEGQMLGGVTHVAGINFEIAGSLFNDLFLITQNQSKEAGFGTTDTILLYTEKGIIVGQCFCDKDIQFHTIVSLKSNGNIAMAKLLLSKTILDLKDEVEKLTTDWSSAFK